MRSHPVIPSVPQNRELHQAQLAGRRNAQQALHGVLHFQYKLETIAPIEK